MGVGTWAGHGTGKPGLRFQRELRPPPAPGPAPQTRAPQQWLSRTLCVPVKGLGELVDQFDCSFKAWIS